MSNLRLQFVLDAVDKATATVTRVGQRIDKLTEPVRRVRASFNGLLEASRFERMRAAWDRLGQAGQGVMAWGRGVAMALTLATAATGGVFLGLKANIDQVDRMLDQAKKLNVPIEQYQRLGYAAQLNGSSVDEMAQALQFLSQNQVEANLGSKEQVQWFQRVGISVQELRRLNTVQLLERIADRFAQVGDVGLNAQKKIAVMRALMGRGGAELKQTLDQGSAGLRRFYEEADRLGGVVSGPAAEAMGDFNDGWDRMTFALRGATSAAALAALPVLNDLVKRVTDWTVANRQLIATRLADFFDKLAPRLPEIAGSLGQIGEALVGLLAGADRFAQMLGGWEVLIGAVAAVIAAQGVVAVISLGQAIWAVGAAIVATPFGLWAAGIAAVVAGAALIYAKWEPIKRFFVDLWDSALAGLNRFVSRLPGFGLVQSLLGITGPAAGPALASPMAAPGATRSPLGAPYRADLGGTLKIEIDANGQPRVRELRKARGSVLDYDVDLGLNLARP